MATDRTAAQFIIGSSVGLVMGASLGFLGWWAPPLIGSLLGIALAFLASSREKKNP